MSRLAIVTGSDSGIGRATAVRLATEGCDVGVTWHGDEDGAHGTAEEVRSHGRRAFVRQAGRQRPRRRPAHGRRARAANRLAM